MDSDIAETLTGSSSSSSASFSASAGRPPHDTTSDVLALFACMWAMASLFHVLGPSGRAVDVFSGVTTVGLLHVAIGIAALAVLIAPRSMPRLLVLAALGPLSAWFEAPVLGSHWALAALIDIGILAAAIAGSRRFARNAVVLARWVFVIGYGFAAFAKLNSGFFNPAVSCGNYFVNELSDSLHLGFTTASSGLAGYIAPVMTATIELSVPVLLVFRRTRIFGVVLGLVFHSVIALDQSHLFSDFSSVLLALFVLFLPPSFATGVVARVRGLERRTRERVTMLALVGLGLVLLAQWFDRTNATNRVFVDGRAWAWLIYDVAVLATVAMFVVRERHALAAEPHAFSWDEMPAWLLVVPALAVMTGLAPYLELRTAYSFNMYANLVTANGDSNHFIIRRTVPLTDFQSDQVHIVASSDPGLAEYADQNWNLPYLQVRAYLSKHPDASVTYRRGNVTRTLAHASDDPALVKPVSSLEQKLYAFRALDANGQPPRCQPSFLPAN
jgi:hypothetical protein